MASLAHVKFGTYTTTRLYSLTVNRRSEDKRKQERGEKNKFSCDFFAASGERERESDLEQLQERE